MTAADRLTELEALHAAALTIRQDYPSLPTLEQHGTEVAACWSDGADMVWIDCEEDADAALIVAAVNALPDLVAAVRGVLALADHIEREQAEDTELWISDVPDIIRSAVASALDRGTE